MSNTPKQTPQETFNAIARASDIPTLQYALGKIDAHNDDEKVALADALEKFTVQGFQEEMSGANLEMIEGLMKFAQMFGEDVLDEGDEDDLYAYHAALLIADKVDEIKGAKTSPLLTDLLDAASEMSDKDYNSLTALAKTFIGVAKKHLTTQEDEAPKAANPFRNRGKKGPQA